MYKHKEQSIKGLVLCKVELKVLMIGIMQNV